MLLAADTGVAVIFEAKVLSDISLTSRSTSPATSSRGSIDVMLEANPALQPR